VGVGPRPWSGGMNGDLVVALTPRAGEEGTPWRARARRGACAPARPPPAPAGAQGRGGRATRGGGLPRRAQRPAPGWQCARSKVGSRPGSERDLAGAPRARRQPLLTRLVGVSPFRRSPAPPPPRPAPRAPAPLPRPGTRPLRNLTTELRPENLSKLYRGSQGPLPRQPPQSALMADAMSPPLALSALTARPRLTKAVRVFGAFRGVRRWL
jgi:hypothetical protein